MLKKEKIICAAIYFDDGKLLHVHQPINIDRGFVISGLRHCNCFGTIQALSNYDDFINKNTQGFLTSKNRFVDRIEGAKIAKKSRQVKMKSTVLFSEDLY